MVKSSIILLPVCTVIKTLSLAAFFFFFALTKLSFKSLSPRQR